LGYFHSLVVPGNNSLASMAMNPSLPLGAGGGIDKQA
jgi:hypothetical protein